MIAGPTVRALLTAARDDLPEGHALFDELVDEAVATHDPVELLRTVVRVAIVVAPSTWSWERLARAWAAAEEIPA